MKVGDKVECVDIGFSKQLKIGEIYTIVSMEPGLGSVQNIRVKEIKTSHSYSLNKFKPVEELVEEDTDTQDIEDVIRMFST